MSCSSPKHGDGDDRGNLKYLQKKTFAKDGDGGVGKCGKQVRGGG